MASFLTIWLTVMAVLTQGQPTPTPVYLYPVTNTSGGLTTLDCAPAAVDNALFGTVDYEPASEFDNGITLPTDGGLGTAIARFNPNGTLNWVQPLYSDATGGIVRGQQTLVYSNSAVLFAGYSSKGLDGTNSLCGPQSIGVGGAFVVSASPVDGSCGWFAQVDSGTAIRFTTDTTGRVYFVAEYVSATDVAFGASTLPNTGGTAENLAFGVIGATGSPVGASASALISNNQFGFGIEQGSQLARLSATATSVSFALVATFRNGYSFGGFSGTSSHNGRVMVVVTGTLNSASAANPLTVTNARSPIDDQGSTIVPTAVAASADGNWLYVIGTSTGSFVFGGWIFTTGSVSFTDPFVFKMNTGTGAVVWGANFASAIGMDGSFAFLALNEATQRLYVGGDLLSHSGSNPDPVIANGFCNNPALAIPSTQPSRVLTLDISKPDKVALVNSVHNDAAGSSIFLTGKRCVFSSQATPLVYGAGVILPEANGVYAWPPKSFDVSTEVIRSWLVAINPDEATAVPASLCAASSSSSSVRTSSSSIASSSPYSSSSDSSAGNQAVDSSSSADGNPNVGNNPASSVAAGVWSAVLTVLAAGAVLRN